MNRDLNKELLKTTPIYLSLGKSTGSYQRRDVNRELKLTACQLIFLHACTREP